MFDNNKQISYDIGMKEQEILTVKEFAAAINVHYNTVRNMIKRGLLSAFRIGYGTKNANYRIPRSEIQRLAMVSLKEIVDDLADKKAKE